MWPWRPGSGFALIRHRRCADRFEGELSIVRVREGKLVTVAAHGVPTVDCQVTVGDDGRMAITCGRLPRTLVNCTMGMRLQCPLTIDINCAGVGSTRSAPN